MAKTRKPRLGRGLSSLLSDRVAVEPPRQAEPASADAPAQQMPAQEPAVPSAQSAGDHQLSYLRIDSIRPSPYQPRQTIDQDELAGLAESIRQDGLMQPVVVRPDPPGGYQLVAGERRWRAAELAGLDTVPAIVRNLDDRQLAEWAVVENLQREDLDSMEQAEAFRRLIDQFGLSHEEVAQRVGVDRSTVSNTLRLLDLQDNAQQAIRQRHLTAGHGRALLGLSDPSMQNALARRAIAGGWSVRMVEAAVRRATRSGEATVPRHSQRSAHLADLQQQISSQMQTKVVIRGGRKKGSGTIAISFYSFDGFDALLAKLGVKIE